MKRRNILVVGSGGREHALSLSLSRSRVVERLFFAPGNPGMSKLGKCVNIDANDFDSLAKFARQSEIDLTVVGPEKPLVTGIVDRFAASGLKAFGPTANAARLEGSKLFAKEFMARHSIPTAEFRAFDSYTTAVEYLRGRDGKVVVKADGLCFGKGVTVADNYDEAVAAVRELMIKKKFGDAGARVIIEDALEGEEVSVVAITDGREFTMLLPSQDHKNLLDGDRGPNTGGMGAYAPFQFADGMEEKVAEILSQTVAGLEEDGVDYKGVIYCVMMITESGPKVLEYNCRFGDPETQAVLPLLDDDLADLCLSVVGGGGVPDSLRWRPGSAVAVVMASDGYPGSFETGFQVEGIEEVESGGAIVFHAGTAVEAGRIVTNGGRVLAVCSTGESLSAARKAAYEACGKIRFQGAYYRKDIGAKGIARENVPVAGKGGMRG